MGKIIRRILTIIPAVALQSLWLLLLMKWLTPYAPIIVSLLSVAAFFLVVFIIIKRDETAYKLLWGDLICGIQQSKLCCQLSKIVYWLARSDFIRPFAGLCSECTRARTGKEASTKAD